MTFSISNHLLFSDGDQVPFSDTPNKSGTINPLYLIMHYTAGVSTSAAIKWLCDARAKASAHLVVGPDGAVTQLVAFNKKAWHAGNSSWNDLNGMNSFSIGIEIVNAGKLIKNESGEWFTWSKHPIPVDEVTIATHKHESSPAGWHLYTDVQLRAATEVGIALNQKYKFLDVLGHDDISPGRKVDPGPAFPMTGVRSRIMGRESA